MLIEVPGSSLSLNTTYITDIVDLFQSESVFSCTGPGPSGPSCKRINTITVQHVAWDADWNHMYSSPRRFHIVAQSVLPGTIQLIQQQMSDQYVPEEIRAAISLSPRLFRVVSDEVQYNAKRHVFNRCGYSAIQSCEECDDGNTNDGDGCLYSHTCIYICLYRYIHSALFDLRHLCRWHAIGEEFVF